MKKIKGLDWRVAVDEATYGVLRQVTNKHYNARYNPTYDAMLGHMGVLKLKDQTKGLNKFSVDCGGIQEVRTKAGGIQPHMYVHVLDGDEIDLYDANRTYLNSIMAGGQVIYQPPHLRATPANPNPQLPTFDTHTVTYTTEDAKRMFTATTVKTKGGYRAQVIFNNKVLWESTTVHEDDTDVKRWNDDIEEWEGKGVSGEAKAKKAAEAAIEQVVEGLFAKIKE